MVIFTSLSNLLSAFLILLIAGKCPVTAHPHPGPDIKNDLPVQKPSITDTSCMAHKAGAVLTSSGTGWNKVSGYFVVPETITSQVPADIYVAIDGCSDAFFQVGIKASPDKSGITRYSAFARWSSEKIHYFENFSIKSGDGLVITAEADSWTSGKASVQSIPQDVTAGVTLSHPFTSTNKLSFSTAEWIVQPYVPEGTKIKFGAVSFTDAEATKFDGTTIYGYDAALYNLDGAADVSIDELGGVTVLFNN